MATVSGREKPLANDGRAGHLGGANSAADLFGKLRLAGRAHGFLQVERRIATALQFFAGDTPAYTAVQLMHHKPLTIHAGNRSSSPRSQPI